MLLALFISLLLATFSGVWLWLRWRQQPSSELAPRRVAAHAISAAGVLVCLVLGLDNHGEHDGWRLLAVFLAISTGMLLFLKRQRLRQFPQRLMLLHGLFAAVALGLTGLLLWP